MRLRRETLRGAIVGPGADGDLRPVSVEVRFDPLTGHTSRLVRGENLLPAADYDLDKLAERTRAGCPFCVERVETAVPRWPADLVSEGWIRVGQALLFPNLLTYAPYAAVCTYGSDLHHLPLAAMTPQVVGDNLAAQVEFARAVVGHDPAARWVVIDANHMLPAGSSLFHPHTQGAVGPLPTTMQAMLAATPAQAFDDYLAAERAAGERWLADTGAVRWLMSFAPLGPAEIRAFVPAVTSPERLGADLVAELARGLSAALAGYAELGVTSFNLALYGAPPAVAGYPLNLRLVARSGVAELYRSDVTHTERLQWEAAIGLAPEDLAERFRPHLTV